MTDRAVAKLQALVRIATVSDRDPSRVDTDAFDRLLAELRTGSCSTGPARAATGPSS